MRLAGKVAIVTGAGDGIGKATALAFAFNAPRFIAFLGPLLAGTMIVHFGGFGRAAMVLATIYIVGIACAPFLPETRGRSLPA